MKRALIGAVSLTLLIAACGGGDESTETTISSLTAPADDAGDETAQTPPPETTPGRTTPSTAPIQSNSGGGGPYGGGGTDGGDTTTTTEADTGTEGSGATVEVADTDLGPILTDTEGMSLYVFLPDEAGESTCYDACAGQWPPLTEEVAAGAGVDDGVLGTTERDDGSTQVTYGGWPLYYFAGDAEAGETNGQGVGDQWFVIDPSGEVVDGQG